MAKCLYPWKHSIEELPDVQYENDKAISGSRYNSMPVGASSSEADTRIFPTCLVYYTKHRNLGKIKRP